MAVASMQGELFIKKGNLISALKSFLHAKEK